MSTEHRSSLSVAIAVTALVAAACEREERRFSESPPSAAPVALVSVSELQPGPNFIRATVEEPYGDIAYAVSEGKRYFNWMNCSGCHANGGGGMGPALMDDEWIYGSDPEQIFATIAQGRPNGMPSFKYRLSNQQIWQLVAYVRSLSGLNPKGARSGRDEHMQVKPAEMQTPNAHPKNTVRP
jgi:cytochrome c oxidase cbb3-type subunit 3